MSLIRQVALAYCSIMGLPLVACLILSVIAHH